MAALAGTAGAALTSRPAVYRELAAGLYSPYAYVAAALLHDAVWCTVPAIIWTVIPFAMAGRLDPSPSAAVTLSAEGRAILGEHFVFVWASQVRRGALRTPWMRPSLLLLLLLPLLSTLPSSRHSPPPFRLRAAR